MNKRFMTILLIAASGLAGCGDETLSCSNPNVTDTVLSLTKKYLNDQAQQTMNPVLLYMSQGVTNLEAIRQDSSSTEKVLTCKAELHIKLDPKVVASANGALKAEPVLTESYSVQKTEDGKDYISLLSLE